MERHIRDAYAHAMSGGRPKGRKPR
jgi:hypothetical protein